MLKTRTTVEWLEALEKEDVPCAPALTRHEVIGHPQVLASEILVEHEHPVAGRLRQTRVPARFEGTPPEAPRGAPRLGEHNDEIMAELGYSAPEIESLRASGALGGGKRRLKARRSPPRDRPRGPRAKEADPALPPKRERRAIVRRTLVARTRYSQCSSSKLRFTFWACGL